MGPLLCSLPRNSEPPESGGWSPSLCIFVCEFFFTLELQSSEVSRCVFWFLCLYLRTPEFRSPEVYVLYVCKFFTSIPGVLESRGMYVRSTPELRSPKVDPGFLSFLPCNPGPLESRGRMFCLVFCLLSSEPQDPRVSRSCLSHSYGHVLGGGINRNDELLKFICAFRAPSSLPPNCDLLNYRASFCVLGHFDPPGRWFSCPFGHL